MLITIDGSLNPPHFYSSEEIEAACIAAGGHLPPRDMALCEPPAQTIATAPHGPLDIPGNLPSAAAAATTGDFFMFDFSFLYLIYCRPPHVCHDVF